MTQSTNHVTERLHAQLPGWNVLVRAQSGNAQCDYSLQMLSDANVWHPRAVVIAFSGDNFTPCATARRFPDFYDTDANWAVDIWEVNNHAALMFVAAPGQVGMTPAQRAVPNIYSAVGKARSVWVADSTPLFVWAGRYATWMPCLIGEYGCVAHTTVHTEVQVRSSDTAHLCVDPACVGYSSGVVRYVDTIIDGVAVITGTPRPVPRQLSWGG